MYCRTFILFCSFLAFYAHSNWENNNLDIKVLAKITNTNGDAYAHYASDEKNLGVSFYTTKLFNGWGVAASHVSSYSSASSETNTDYHNRDTSLKLKLFVRDNSDLEVNLSQKSFLNSNGIVSTNFLNQAKPQYIHDSRQAAANINIGNDQDYWNVKISTNIDELTSKDISTRTVFREYNHSITDISFGWKLSEDSYLTAKYSIEDNKYLQSNTFYTTSIINSYIGFKTQYLSSSMLSMDIGSSKVSGSDNAISWKLTHKTNINDYFIVSLSNGRRFSIANDFRFNANLNTYSNLNIVFTPSSYYSVNLTADFKDGSIAESINIRTQSTSTSLNVKYLTNWNSSVFIQQSEYQDDRGLFNYNQTQIGFKISRDLI